MTEEDDDATPELLLVAVLDPCCPEEDASDAPEDGGNPLEVLPPPEDACAWDVAVPCEELPAWEDEPTREDAGAALDAIPLVAPEEEEEEDDDEDEDEDEELEDEPPSPPVQATTPATHTTANSLQPRAILSPNARSVRARLGDARPSANA